MKKYRILSVSGEPCPRCGGNSEVREHTNISDKHLKQPFYFTRWFRCVDYTCPTTIFMKEEYKVWNKNVAARKMNEYEEYHQQINFIRNIT